MLMFLADGRKREGSFAVLGKPQNKDTKHTVCWTRNGQLTPGASD